MCFLDKAIFSVQEKNGGSEVGWCHKKEIWHPSTETEIRQDRMGYKTLFNRAVLEMINCEGIETTIRRRQLLFAGAFVRLGKRAVSERIMHRWLAVQGSKGTGRTLEYWDNLQENLCALGALFHAKECDGRGSSRV